MFKFRHTGLLLFVLFYSDPLDKHRDSSLSQVTTCSFHIFPVYFLLIMPLFSAVFSELLTASLNIPEINYDKKVRLII